jgi:maleate cis-trans isomerase
VKVRLYKFRDRWRVGLVIGDTEHVLELNEAEILVRQLQEAVSVAHMRTELAQTATGNILPPPSRSTPEAEQED